MARAFTLENNISNITQIIAYTLPNSKVIIFGSYARGTQNEHSDIDICVIVDDLKMRRIEACHLLRKSFIGKINVPIDILVFEKKDFEENSKNPSTIEYTIAKEGVEL